MRNVVLVLIHSSEGVTGMYPSSKTIQGQLAHASRRDSKTDPRTLAILRRDHKAAQLAEMVAREVRKIEPLTDEQITRISQIMRGQAN